MDGFEFHSIGRVAGAGTSKTRTLYEMIDPEPAQASNYYRLRQVDFDGKIWLSKTILVTSDGLDDLAIYPNPTHGEPIRIRSSFIEKESVIELVNTLGVVLYRRYVRELPIEGNIITVEGSQSLPAGVLFLRIAGKQSAVHKVVKTD